VASPDHGAAVRLVAPQLAGAAVAVTRGRKNNATAAPTAGSEVFCASEHYAIRRAVQVPPVRR